MGVAFRLAATGAAFALVSSTAAHAAPVCLTLSNGAPQFIQGIGKASQQNVAQNKATSDWSSKVSPLGSAYQSWSAAARKNLSCNSAKVAFSWVYTCAANAQPCK